MSTKDGLYHFTVDKENDPYRAVYNEWDFPVVSKNLLESKFREYLDTHNYSDVSICQFDIKDAHYFPDIRLCVTYRGEEYNVLVPFHDSPQTIYWASGIVPPQEDRIDVELIIKNYVRKVYKGR